MPEQSVPTVILFGFEVWEEAESSRFPEAFVARGLDETAPVGSVGVCWGPGGNEPSFENLGSFPPLLGSRTGLDSSRLPEANEVAFRFANSDGGNTGGRAGFLKNENRADV